MKKSLQSAGVWFKYFWCIQKYFYACEGVWTLCKNLVIRDLHASTTSEHTVGTLCPYMQTSGNSISSELKNISPNTQRLEYLEVETSGRWTNRTALICGERMQILHGRKQRPNCRQLNLRQHVWAVSNNALSFTKCERYTKRVPWAAQLKFEVGTREPGKKVVQCTFCNLW